MGAIDFLLNLAGLLLWISWRSQQFDPLAKSTPVTLVGTLKRAQASTLKRGPLVLVIFGLILFRALIYWLIGTPANWTPKINLELVVLAFRGDQFPQVLLYSCLSFLRLLIVFYFWLLVLALVNGGMDADALTKLVRLHLGRMVHWPWLVQLALPFVVIFGLWLTLHPLLVHLGVVASVHSGAHLAEQALLVSLGLILSLKYLLPSFLLLHLVASYVYLGTSPFWDFVAKTSGRLTAPLRRVPLRLARVDLAPVLGVILILCLLEWLPNLTLSKLSAANLSTWPL
jgi:uncharacterized protein YggT (Ycf19 family)